MIDYYRCVPLTNSKSLYEVLIPTCSPPLNFPIQQHTMSYGCIVIRIVFAVVRGDPGNLWKTFCH